MDVGADEKSVFAKLMTSAAARMLADFQETTTVQHSGSKGTSREALLASFLKKYLPGTTRIVHNGEVFNAVGARSPQCDILVTSLDSPQLRVADAVELVPIECLHGVIEVKSHLDGKELRDAWRKISRIKAIERTALDVPWQPARYRKQYGRTWEEFSPTSGMIFAYSGMGLDSIAGQIAELATEQSGTPELQVDSVWVLDQGGIVWVDTATRKINVSPNPEDGFAIVRTESAAQVLMQFIAHAHQHFGKVWSPGFKVDTYFGSASWGNLDAQVWTPPPAVPAD